MTLDMPGWVIRVARPDAPVFRELYFSCVGHSRRHRDHRQLFRLWIEPNHSVAACAADPDQARATIHVDRIRYVVSLARERILLPSVVLWIVAAEVSAPITRYPYDSIVRYFQTPRTVHRRL